jgi:uncharacterized protein DUF4440
MAADNALHRRRPKMNLRLPTLGLVLCLGCATGATRQTSTTEQGIIQLSKNKWQWMADKDVGKLEPLFHDRSKFVHMSGTWKKAEELDIIKTGRIWYKQADVHDVAVEMFENTALVWSRITLDAVVGGNEVVTQFTVTEVYQRQRNDWKLLDLTFSSVRDTHQIRK